MWLTKVLRTIQIILQLMTSFPPLRFNPNPLCTLHKIVSQYCMMSISNTTLSFPIIHIRLSIGLGNGAMCRVLNEHVIPKHVIRTTC